VSSSSSSSSELLTAAGGSGTRRTDRHRPQAGGTTSRLAPPTPRPRACVTLRVTHRVGSGGDALHAFLALECTRLLCQPMRPSFSRPCPLARSESVATLSLSGSSRRSSSIYCSLRRVALPCLAFLVLPALFSLFFFFSRRTKGPRVRYRSPAAAALSCVCPILLVSSGSGSRLWQVATPFSFSFSFCSLRPNGSRRIGLDPDRSGQAATIFLRLALRFPVLPRGRQTDAANVSARCHRSVPFRSCTITRSVRDAF
jgi:hypothetical protein